MLVEFSVADFALAEDVVIRPGSALTMLTGETGAGKSMIAGALALLAGGPAPKDLVRSGRSEAVVEGAFELAENGPARRELARHGVQPDDGGFLVIRREIRREGRSRVLINGRLSSLAVLEQIGPALIAVQSQDQQRELADPDFARRYLDAHLDHGELLREAADTHAAFTAARDELAARRDEERLLREQIDLWRYQRDELDRATLDPEEEPRLAERLAILRHAADLREAIAAALDALAENDGAARAGIGRAAAALARGACHSESLAALAAQLDLTAEALDDVVKDLRRFADDVAENPRELAEVEERRALYRELERKYATDVPGLIELRDRLAARIDRREVSRRELAELEERCEMARRELERAANRLSEHRRGGAGRAAAEAESVLRSLALPTLEVALVVEPNSDGDGPISIDGCRCAVARHGADRVALLVKTNPGEPMAAASEIASGGEKSRIHLGLATLLKSPAAGRLFVLDEIDAGLGMDTAPPVARLLRRLAVHNQVICITHLPTMAVYGHDHLKVEKIVRGGRTSLRVQAVVGEDRVGEVARLLGGEGYARADHDSQQSYARQLLRAGGLAAVAGA
jgi:DNA repair protein RecN (Recombination protein N)